jgi:hypothetical protein
MASDLDIPFDRVTYRDGQLLTALDLRDDLRRDARLRRLHTRYLHDTWGIALGFEVTQVGDKGERVEKGGKAVAVGPGYAVDGTGRDILLAENIHLTVPYGHAPEAFVLTVSYQEDAAFRDRPHLASVCLSGGLDPSHERANFAWRRPEEVRFGPEVPLVQVFVADGVIQGELDFRVRRNARALVRPHIGWGATELDRTRWVERVSKVTIDKQQVEVRVLEVEVDTSEAGFTRAPYYFALLQGDFGHRGNGEEPLFESDLWPSSTEPAFFLDTFGFISHAAEESFTYRIGDQPPFKRIIQPSEAKSRRWRISWLGIEPVTGCEPALNLAWLFVLAGFPLHLLASMVSSTSEA